MIIKVKLVGAFSTRALMENGFNLPDDSTNTGVCFHAFSPTMKAKVLEYMATQGDRLKIELSVESGERRDGEWME